MTVRTLIEITCETARDHERELEAALDKLGFRPKDDPEHVRFMDDLWSELNERGLKAHELVEARREKRRAELA